MESYGIQLTVPASKKKSYVPEVFQDLQIRKEWLLSSVWIGVLNDNLKTGVWPQDEEGGPDHAKGEDHSCSDAQ